MLTCLHTFIHPTELVWWIRCDDKQAGIIPDIGNNSYTFFHLPFRMNKTLQEANQLPPHWLRSGATYQKETPKTRGELAFKEDLARYNQGPPCNHQPSRQRASSYSPDWPYQIPTTQTTDAYSEPPSLRYPDTFYGDNTPVDNQKMTEKSIPAQCVATKEQLKNIHCTGSIVSNTERWASLKPIRLIEWYVAISERVSDTPEGVEVPLPAESVSTQPKWRWELSSVEAEKDEVTPADTLPTNQDDGGWGDVIDKTKRLRRTPRVKVEYDGKNDPSVWNTTTRQMRDLSWILEGMGEEIATIARYYRNYESGNIGIPDWIEEAKTFPDRKRWGEYYLIAEVISLLREVLDGEVDSIRKLYDTWYWYRTWMSGKTDWAIWTDFDDTPVLRLSLYTGNMHRLFMTRVLGCAI